MEFRFYRDFYGNAVVDVNYKTKTFWREKDCWIQIASGKIVSTAYKEKPDDYVFLQLKKYIEEEEIRLNKLKFVPEYTTFTEEDVKKGQVKLFRTWKSK